MIDRLARLEVGDEAFLVYTYSNGKGPEEIRVNLRRDIVDFDLKTGPRNGQTPEEYGQKVLQLVSSEKGLWLAEAQASCQDGVWICPVLWYVQ